MTHLAAENVVCNTLINWVFYHTIWLSNSLRLFDNITTQLVTKAAPFINFLHKFLFPCSGYVRIPMKEGKVSGVIVSLLVIGLAFRNIFFLCLIWRDSWVKATSLLIMAEMSEWYLLAFRTKRVWALFQCHKKDCNRFVPLHHLSYLY